MLERSYRAPPVQQMAHHQPAAITAAGLHVDISAEEGGQGGRRYQRKAVSWPPPAKYLHAGPIGFTDYLQTWFRYYLQQHIEHAMSEIETKEGLYSIEFGREVDDGEMDGNVIEARGSLVDRDGQWWEHNVSHERPALDLSRMNLEWVQHTDDPLFADLSRTDRLLLYLVFVRERKAALQDP